MPTIDDPSRATRWRRCLFPVGAAVSLALLLLACGAGDDAADEVTAEPIEPRSGGMTTAFDDSPRALSLSARNINHYERIVFADGKEVFEASWTEPPNDEFGGLGPDFDTAACSLCHIDDGRAPGPSADGPLPEGLVVKLTTDDPTTVDRLGGQITRSATTGQGEAVVSVTYEEVTGEFADGESYSLRSPIYTVEASDGVALPPDAVLGVRQPPALTGLGLLELVSVDDLEALADPDDDDADGVSGRLGEAVDLPSGVAVVGRFGWNASQPSVEQQSATALFNDMGLTSRYFPSAGCADDGPCDRPDSGVTGYYEPSGFGPDAYEGFESDPGWEVSDQRLYELTVYTIGLTVPAVRDIDDSEVLRGRDLFLDAGCASCHAGPYQTEVGPMQGLSDQTIYPFTDLLVHDLGDDLGDQRVDGETVETEWRTPPLWGVGLIETVNGHTTLLHDGRARNLSEAILWHGGEAEATREAYLAMPGEDRSALLRYLSSL